MNHNDENDVDNILWCRETLLGEGFLPLTLRIKILKRKKWIKYKNSHFNNVWQRWRGTSNNMVLERGASTNTLQAINTICCVILVNIPKRLEDMNILQNNYYGSLVTSCLIYDVQSPFDWWYLWRDLPNQTLNPISYFKRYMSRFKNIWKFTDISMNIYEHYIMNIIYRLHIVP